MKVRWTESAKADVRAILSYIASHDPSAAAKWAQKLNGLIGQLARFPASGHKPYDNSPADLREIRHGDYRIFYQHTEGVVFISRVWHGARRPPWQVTGSDQDE